MQDELVGAKSNTSSDKALTSSEAPTLPLIPLPAKDLFTKFMKMFIETTQTQTELQERLLKAKTPETYWGKSHMECYHFLSVV